MSLNKQMIGQMQIGIFVDEMHFLVKGLTNFFRELNGIGIFSYL